MCFDRFLFELVTGFSLYVHFGDNRIVFEDLPTSFGCLYVANLVWPVLGWWWNKWGAWRLHAWFKPMRAFATDCSLAVIPYVLYRHELVCLIFFRSFMFYIFYQTVLYTVYVHSFYFLFSLCAFVGHCSLCMSYHLYDFLVKVLRHIQTSIKTPCLNCLFRTLSGHSIHHTMERKKTRILCVSHWIFSVVNRALNNTTNSRTILHQHQ